MSSQTRPNQHELFTATNIYLDAMRPFVFRNMKKAHVAAEERIEDPDDVDIGDFPHLVRRHWQSAFAQHFDPQWDARSRISLIKEARNRVSHPRTKDISLDYALARLEDIADVLEAINAPNQASKVRDIRNKLSSEPHVATPVQPSESSNPDPEMESPPKKISDLTPWREVISPNSDVIDGTFRKSEFAADLQEVYDGKAKTEAYGETDVFFNQTYITPGLRGVLVNTLQRLGQKSGAPVIQMKTGFGGGKTHSLIALYHFVTGAKILMQLPEDAEYTDLRAEIRDIMLEAQWDPEMEINANVSVLVGTYLSTTDTDKTKNGDPLNTLWGRMADQLGGQDAYDIIGEAARKGISPGGKQLDELFEHVGPSVILIDELVAYTRNVEDDTRDRIYTFVQNLTESVGRCEHIALVVTLPESQTQAGAAAGNEALEKIEEILDETLQETFERKEETWEPLNADDETLQETFERKEETWEPLNADEAFAVVRRRLFGSDIDESERDRTCKAYMEMYRHASSEYPEGTSDQHYLQRMKECYPIHPEIFDRLYHDWSAIPAFQRTRGVLRIMANCISRLYQKQDPSPLVMPANLTFDDSALADEFTKLLSRSGGRWNPVLAEIDRDGSSTDRIDMGSTTFINVGGAARRVARTIFLGSATGRAVKGITIRQIHLGTVVPGQGVSVYNDALSRMSGNLFFLYNLDDRYYFNAEENLNKVAKDRSKQYTDEHIHEEIVSRLKRAIGRTPEAQICPTSTSEIHDLETRQFIVLHPTFSLPSRASEKDTAETEALKILKYSGNNESQRTFRNTLLFVTAKRDDVRVLETHVKHYLAWHSIINGDSLHEPITNLKETRLDQATEKVESSDDDVRTSLFKAYRWILTPVQADPKQDDYYISKSTIDSQDGRIVKNASDKCISEEVIIADMAASLFADKLNQYIWSSDTYSDHITLNTLWNLLARHVYMPRMKDTSALTKCVQQGVEEGKFGYATKYENDTYPDLKFQEPISRPRIAENSTAILVNPELAKLIKEEEPNQPKPEPSNPSGKKHPEPKPEPPREIGSKHVVVTKNLQLEMDLGNDIDILQKEIIRTLQDDGGVVTVQVIVTADKSEGFSENTTRAVKQNSEHLNAAFKSD